MRQHEMQTDSDRVGGSRFVRGKCVVELETNVSVWKPKVVPGRLTLLASMVMLC
jgi:hypothetical protein